MKIFRGNSDGHLNIRRNLLGIFSLIRGKRIFCACISINLYCSSEFPRNIPRKYGGTSVWGFKTSIFFAVFHFSYNCNAYHWGFFVLMSINHEITNFKTNCKYSLYRSLKCISVSLMLWGFRSYNRKSVYYRVRNKCLTS